MARRRPRIPNRRHGLQRRSPSQERPNQSDSGSDARDGAGSGLPERPASADRGESESRLPDCNDSSKPLTSRLLDTEDALPFAECTLREGERVLRGESASDRDPARASLFRSARRQSSNPKNDMSSSSEEMCDGTHAADPADPADASTATTSAASTPRGSERERRTPPGSDSDDDAEEGPPATDGVPCPSRTVLVDDDRVSEQTVTDLRTSLFADGTIPSPFDEVGMDETVRRFLRDEGVSDEPTYRAERHLCMLLDHTHHSQARTDFLEDAIDEGVNEVPSESPPETHGTDQARHLAWMRANGRSDPILYVRAMRALGVNPDLRVLVELTLEWHARAGHLMYKVGPWIVFVPTTVSPPMEKGRAWDLTHVESGCPTTSLDYSTLPIPQDALPAYELSKACTRSRYAVLEKHLAVRNMNVPHVSHRAVAGDPERYVDANTIDVALFPHPDHEGTMRDSRHHARRRLEAHHAIRLLAHNRERYDPTRTRRDEPFAWTTRPMYRTEARSFGFRYDRLLEDEYGHSSEAALLTDGRRVGEYVCALMRASPHVEVPESTPASRSARVAAIKRSVKTRVLWHATQRCDDEEYHREVDQITALMDVFQHSEDIHVSLGPTDAALAMHRNGETLT